MFTLYTYIAPVLAETTGTGHDFLAAMLVLIGIGFTVGNVIGGRMADRSADGAIIGLLLAAVALEMLAMPYMMRAPAVAAGALFIWSATVFALVPCVQLRVLEAARDAPGLASSINIGAFNLGNALGALVGAAAISVGAAYRFLPVAGSVLALGELVMVHLTRQNRT